MTMPSIMALPTHEQELMATFGEGRMANSRDEPMDANPHPAATEQHAAWDAGWQEEEGPAYVLGDRARRDYRRPTLADIWPTLIPGRQG